MSSSKFNFIFIFASLIALGASACSDESPTPPLKESPHVIPEADCDEGLRGQAPAFEETTEITGVANYTWNVDKNGIEVSLGGTDEADLGVIHTRLEIDFSNPSTWDVVTEHRVDGQTPVVQTQTYRPLGPDRIWLQIENVIQGQRMVSWIVLNRNFEPQRITLGKPVLATDTPSPNAFTTPDGVFETFDFMVDGQTTSADSWITAQGLDALLENPAWVRFLKSATDAAWVVPASEQARLCQGDQIEDAELRLRRMALGCDDDLQRRLEGAGNAWGLIGAVGTAMAITGAVIALGVTGGATIGVVLIVSGVGAYYAQSALDAVVAQNPGAYKGAAIDGVARAAGVDGSAAKDFFGAGSGGGGGGGGAKSSGDPHLDTHDGKSYDFQAAGEFVAVQGADFEIQVRQVPVDGLCDNVSLNTAVAARVGNSRVAFYVGDERVWVDGVAMNTPANALNLPDGVVNRITDNTFHLWWDSGDGMEVRIHSTSMTIRIYLPSGRSGTVAGIFGDFDGDPSNDLQLPDGTVMPTPANWELLVTLFADSWRVTSENSLFDYRPSEGPETFAIPGFPSRPMTVDDVPAAARASAEGVCRASGIMNPIAFEDCVLDVACTGDSRYAEDHEDRDPTERVALEEPVFLNNWTQEGAPNNGNWVVGNDERSVIQTLNGDPTFYVSSSDYFDKTLRGRFRSEGGDDDYIGFVFGYKSPRAANGDPNNRYNTFVLSWKGATQNPAQEGFTLAHANGTISDPLPNFWEQTSDANYRVIATDYSAGSGWRANRDYDFELSYGASGIRILIDGEVVFDLTPAEVGVPLESGRFGFYNYSQPNVTYSDFTVVAASGSRSLNCVDALPFPEIPSGAALIVPGNAAYLIEGVLAVNVPVTVEAGALICMGDGAGIDVIGNGSFAALGEPFNPIRITGAERQRGTWRAIRFGSNSPLNELRWTEVAYGGGSALASVESANIAVDSIGSLRLSNVSIRESAAVGLWTEGALPLVVDGLSKFINNTGAPVSIDVEHVRGLSPTVRFVGDNGDDDRVVVRGTNVSTAGFTWPALDATYRVTSLFSVAVPITVAAGVELEFDDGAGINVSSGSLRVQGTNASRVIMRASGANAWRGIRYASTSTENVIRFATISDGGDSAQASVESANVAVDSTGRLSIQDSTFTDSLVWGVWVEDGANFEATGTNVFLNNGNAGLRIAPMHMARISGNGQYLGANGVDVVYVSSGSISASGTWDALDAPYLLDAVVDVRADINIEAGASFQFADNGGLNVSTGMIIAMGTQAAPIVIQGVNETPGSHRGIRIAAPGKTSVLQHVQIWHGGGSAQASVESANVAVDSTGNLRITDSRFSDSDVWGVWVEGGAGFDATGANIFTGNSQAGLRIAPMHMARVSGNGQYLGGNGIDAVYVADGTVNANGTWDALDAPYLLDAIVDIRADITIQAGASFQLDFGGGLNVSTGLINAIGTAAEPIIFKGLIELPESHRGIRIAAPGKTSILQNVEVWHGGGSAQASVEPANVAVDSTGSLRVTDSRFSDSGLWGVWVEGGAGFDATGANVFTGNTQAGLHIAPEHMARVSGNGQYLGGNGIDAVYVASGTTNANGTWDALDAPYLLVDLVDVRAGITIQAGANFRLDAGGGLNVSAGTITANGTAGAPIRFLGLIEAPGSHRGIRIAAAGSIMSYVEVAHGGGSSQASVQPSNVAVDSTGSLTISNATLRDSGLHGLYNEGTTTISNSALNNNEGFGVYNTGVLNPTNLTYSGNLLGQVGP